MFCGIIGLIVIGVMTFIGDLACRPNNNNDGEKQGLAFRTHQKIHTSCENGQTRTLYPNDTNLCKTDVAGPGTLLHFNFQALCILWAFVVGCTWLSFCTFVDNDLFTLGMGNLAIRVRTASYLLGASKSNNN